MAATFFILKHGIAPPGLSKEPESIRLLFWGWVVDLGLRRKDWELARGLNAKGEPLPGVAPATRKHRRSAMTPSGKGSPSAPYLMPGKGLSRTRSLLAGKAHRDHAEFFWRFDPWTGDQWGKILHHHAKRGQAYNVVGLSPAGVRWVAAQARQAWERHRLGLPPLPTDPTAARWPASAGPMGKTDLSGATFGIGATREQAEKAIREGRSSGFRTAAEWEKHWRSKTDPFRPTAPGRSAWSVRQGASNIILQTVWGGPTGGGAIPMPTPAPKPTPKPVERRKAALKPAGPRKLDRLARNLSTRVVINPKAPDDVRTAASEALRVIDSLHAVVKANSVWTDESRADEDALGTHVYGAVTTRVTLKPGVAGQIHTALHEFGHDVDYTIRRAVEGEGFGKTNPALADAIKAARESKLVRSIQNHRDALARAMATAESPEERGRFSESLEYQDYLLRDVEIWARAYSYWVARRSGDKAAAESLEALRGVFGDNSPHHWTDEDFRPIAAAIEAVFIKLGWLK